MKKLSYLLRSVNYVNLLGSPDSHQKDPSIKDVQFDYKAAGKNDVYFALIYPGREGNRPSDGHDYIEQVITQGSTVIVCEHLPEKIREHITYIHVENVFEAMAIMIANFYDNPAEQLKIIGVTGTNGKTSVVTLLHELFCKLGRRAGLISTVVDKVNDTPIPTDGTTPKAKELNQLWRQMVDANCEYCFMEVTSHAIFQKRVANVKFTGTIFTSISADHLGYHKTFEEYIRVKKSFFDDATSDAFAVYNSDDPYGAKMIMDTTAQINAVSMKNTDAGFYFRIIENTLNGLVLNIDGQVITSKLVATFNAYNLLSAYATAILLGEDKAEVLNLLPSLSAIEGRANIVKSKDNKIGIIDFAHNLDALVKLYKLLIPMKNNRLITIIGCGGDRIRQRAKIGKVTYENSDMLILTSDNPRTEDPLEIIKEMTAEINPTPEKAITIVDREEAIKYAVEIAEPEDIILLASKGHESYQEIKGKKYPFNDKEILIKYFNADS